MSRSDEQLRRRPAEARTVRLTALRTPPAALVLALALFLLSGGSAAAQTYPYIDTSERAATLLEAARRHLAAEEHGEAVAAVVGLLKIGPEAVFPGSHQGVGLAARELVLALPPEARKLYGEALDAEALAALREAEAAQQRSGLAAALGDYGRLAREYPGTPAARSAAARVWAFSFESGQLTQVVEQLEDYLRDAALPVEERRRALLVLGLAAAELGHGTLAGETAALLKALPGGAALRFLGGPVDAAALLAARIAKVAPGGNNLPTAAGDDWRNVGGRVDRCGASGGSFQFTGRTFLHEEPSPPPDTSGAAEERGPPVAEFLQALLERRASAGNVQVEETILVTDRTIFVTRGRHLVAVDRRAGRERWRLRIAPEAAVVRPVTWASCEDGLVAVNVAELAGAGLAGSVLAAADVRTVNSALRRRLLVVDEATGATLWQWSAADPDEQAKVDHAARGELNRRLKEAKATVARQKREGIEDQKAEAELAALQQAAAEETRKVTAERKAGLKAGPAVADSPEALAAEALRAAGLKVLEGQGAAEELALPPELEPSGSPLLYGGRLFIGAALDPHNAFPIDNYLLCFEARTGRLQWQRFVGSGTYLEFDPCGTSLDHMIPATDGRRVYVESSAGSLAAVDLATGLVAWTQTMPRPQPRRNDLWGDANCASGVADGPGLSGELLIVTDVMGPKIRCLRAADGSPLWETVVPRAGWRVGVQEGAVYYAAADTLTGYDLKSGAPRAAIRLPGEITGRGFLVTGAAYLPTLAGVARVGLDDRAVTVVVAPDAMPGATAGAMAGGRAGAAGGVGVGATGDQRRPRAIVPAGSTMLCEDGRSLWVMGNLEAMTEEVRGRHEADPRSAVWSLRLADLRGQRGDYAEAAALLRSCLREAAAAAERTEAEADGSMETAAQAAARQVWESAARRLVTLSRHWAEQLRGEEKFAEAAGLLEQSLSLAAPPSEQLAVRTILAGLQELSGDRQSAEANYRQVAADPRAETVLLMTDTPGLVRPAAAEADLGLRRLKSAVDGGAGATAKPPAVPIVAPSATSPAPPAESPAPPSVPRFVKREPSIDRQKVSSLAPRIVAMMSWSSPSYLASDAEESFAPLLWIRTDSLAAFGPDGRLRWYLDRGPQTEENLPWVEMRGGMIYQKSAAEVTASDAGSGSLKWRWPPPPDRQLRKPPGANSLAREQTAMHIPGSQEQWTSAYRENLLGDEPMDFHVTDKVVLVGSAPREGAGWRVNALDRLTGRELWTLELAKGQELRGIKGVDARVVIVGHGSDGRFVVQCLDEVAGRQLWRHEETIPRGRKIGCLFEGGYFVSNDSAGRCTVLETTGGQIVRQEQSKEPWLVGALPVAATGDGTVFSCEQGYLLAAHQDGAVRWRVPASRHDARAERPLLAGRLLVSWIAKEIVALRLDGGQRAWAGGIKEAAAGGYGLHVVDQVVVATARNRSKPLVSFIELSSGRLLGQCQAAKSAGLMRVLPVYGGLYVQAGDELVLLEPAPPAPPAADGAGGSAKSGEKKP